MDIEDGTDSIAAEVVRARGRYALNYLRERAAAAKAGGDMESAVAWWDVIIAAAALMEPSARH
jgi:hypothetical protein